MSHPKPIKELIDILWDGGWEFDHREVHNVELHEETAEWVENPVGHVIEFSQAYWPDLITCSTCGGSAPRHDDAFVCDDCDDEWWADDNLHHQHCVFLFVTARNAETGRDLCRFVDAEITVPGHGTRHFHRSKRDALKWVTDPGELAVLLRKDAA